VCPSKVRYTTRQYSVIQQWTGRDSAHTCCHSSHGHTTSGSAGVSSRASAKPGWGPQTPPRALPGTQDPSYATSAGAAQADATSACATSAGATSSGAMKPAIAQKPEMGRRRALLNELPEVYLAHPQRTWGRVVGLGEAEVSKVRRGDPWPLLWVLPCLFSDGPPLPRLSSPAALL